MISKSYFFAKIQFVPTTIVAIGLLLCCSSIVHSQNETPDEEQNYHINFEDLYFTDYNTYRSNYLTGRVLFGQYESIGIGNRFNNITINNYGVNIYTNIRPLELGRINWVFTTNQLKSWGWINKGWNTPWNQSGWRSISNSWNGPVWNYWGYTASIRELRIIEVNQIYARNSYERSKRNQGNRLSVYQRSSYNSQKKNNLAMRTRPRSRPVTKKGRLNNIETYNTNRSNTRSRSTRAVQTSNSRSESSGSSRAISSSNSSRTTFRSSN